MALTCVSSQAREFGSFLDLVAVLHVDAIDDAAIGMLNLFDAAFDREAAGATTRLRAGREHSTRRAPAQ